MPKFAYCFFDNASKKFGAIEISCGKGTSLISAEMNLLAKCLTIKVMDDQTTDKEVLLVKNPQLRSKILCAERQLQDKITISNIWI